MPSTTSRAPFPISKSTTSPIQKKKMSLTQTYYLAHTARAKLSKEASRADHDLRLLVGHANLLDGLMIDLVDAEREQESWFNQSVRGAQEPDQSKHIRWADQHQQVPTIAEEEEYETEEDDDDSSDEEDEVAATLASLRQAAAQQPSVSAIEVDEEDDDDAAIDDDEEDYAHLQLTRTPSHSPPELMHESSDSESDEESMPPSPPAPVQAVFAPSQRPQKPISQVETAFYEEGFYLPERQAVSVY